MSRAVERTEPLTSLPLHAVYKLALLAKATSLDARTLKTILERAGVQFVRAERGVWVPLSELELKVPALWESVKAAEMLRHHAG